MQTLVKEPINHARSESERRPHIRRGAWIVMLVAGAGLVLYGVLAVVNPSMMAAGYESYSGEAWAQLDARSAATAGYLLWVYRLIGGLNVVLGLMLVAMTLGAARRGERWAWWALLVGYALGYGVPMAYDQITGYVGLFEILEYVVLAAVVASFVSSIRALTRH